MTPKPLPAQVELPSELSTLSSNIPTAYSSILELEKSPDEKKRMYARILGYLLLHGPSDEARKTVAEEVVSCENEDQLARNGKYYFDSYLCPFKQFGGCSTPTGSPYPSQPGFDDSKSYEVAKQQALVRDGYRCLVTRNYDFSSIEHNPKLNQEAVIAGARAVSTQCAHIFDSSTNSNLSDESSDKCDYAKFVWAVMKRFGYKDIPKNLNGDNIHSLDNILTLDPTIHDLFDRLKIWFEPTNEKHEYRLEATNPICIRALEKPVKFTTPDPVEYPLPSPLYLHIHATCAKITHLSGAGEYIDKIVRDLEDIKVLSEEGVSAGLLYHVLLPLSSELLVQ